MSGFSTTRSNIWGIDNISKQFGSILRGYGPPVPKAGVLGDLYIDNDSYQLFEKRCVNTLDDWGHYLWVVPPAYQRSLKWFGAGRPSDTLGKPGDYFLQWAGYNNYGMFLTLFGPKLTAGWPENGEGDNNNLNIKTAAIHRLGLMDVGSDLADLSGNQLIATGLVDEYLIPSSVTADPGSPVQPIGVPSTGQLVVTSLNPLYTAEDEHGI